MDINFPVTFKEMFLIKCYGLKLRKLIEFWGANF